MSDPARVAPLPAEALITACDPDRLGFDDTAEVQPLALPVGQERVLEAVDFATAIARRGYNLYVMGPPGIGRHRLVRDLLAAKAATRPPPSDWCYVADFETPERPRALELPAGRGTRLRRDMRQLLEDLLTALPAAFQSDEYRRRAREIQDAFKQREEQAAAEMGRRAAERGIALIHTPTGYTLAPLKDGKVLDPGEFQALEEDEQARLQAAMSELKEALRKVLGDVPLWQREVRQRFRDLNADITQLAVSQLMRELHPQYADLPGVSAYLAAVQADVVEHGELFRSLGDEETVDVDDPRFLRYRVNLLVDHATSTGAPVVFEDNPTCQNLVGRIEHVAQMGTLSTNFMLIKPGALQRANGGYLLIDVDRLLTQPFAWNALKRALQAGEVRIESIDRMVGLMSSLSLEPEPIPLHLKVALVGDRELYYLLQFHDPDFASLFKVVADFNADMPRADDRVQAYAGLVAMLQQGERLKPVSRAGFARLVDWATRQAHNGARLSLHLGRLTDLLQQADHFARLGDTACIDDDAIQAAIDAQARRGDQVRRRLHEAILDHRLLIDTDGRQLGQVNGLVVVATGDDSFFGSPVRISATARMGNGTLIDIETEAKLSGAIHSKGVMILSAYLANRYARHQPLSVSASLVFEQSYGEIDGDSASLGELCALLSAIGDLSLDQSLALTGSVNQHGQVQAIGGVNEKIEGFFAICDARGLTGRQGVIVPAANAGDLMLHRDVRDAAARDRFRIYAVDHADQAMALLTGMPAGQPDANGLYPEASCNGQIQRRLFEWTAVRQRLGGATDS